VNYNTPILKFLDRLQQVRPAGNDRWTALCPAHEDRSPSLSIRDTGDKILIHCHAGCATDDVLAAVGLTFRDLYADEWRASYAAATASHQGRRYSESLLRDANPLDLERMVLRIADADRQAGKALSAEDLARVEVARMRLAAAREDV
jgi:hypothetical protein